MIRRKKERSKQNFILIVKYPLISSVGSNGVSKYLEDIRIIILYFEMNFEYKVITEVAGRYNTGNCLFSLPDLGKQHHNKHRPPYFSEYLADNINAKCALQKTPLSVDQVP